ncbi:shikimate dehydrogenase [Rhodococcus aerolatus]
MLGSPVGHSRSPDLHRAAYAALGLTGWTYTRVECDAAGLAPLVDGLGPEWVGLSVTMPAKLAALGRADTRSERSAAVGAANTLVRRDGGWWADCTDVDGAAGALAELGHGRPDVAGRPVLVLGAGGTARAVVAALAREQVAEVVVAVREPARADGVRATAERLGVPLRVVRLDAVTAEAGAAAACVSTVPADAQAALVDALAPVRSLLDVVYHPWPTPLAAAVLARGGRVVGGARVLLHQAFGQVEAFTGLPAPRAAMAAALAAPPG